MNDRTKLQTLALRVSVAQWDCVIAQLTDFVVQHGRNKFRPALKLARQERAREALALALQVDTRCPEVPRGAPRCPEVPRGAAVE